MTTTSTQFSLVIESEDTLNHKLITISDLKRWLLANESAVMYWSIVAHDKDHNEQGELIRTHYHMVIVLRTPKANKTVINDIAKFLLINKNCISCKVVTSFVKCVQYLIHYNDKDKYQYTVEDIDTSDRNDLLTTILESTSQYEFDFNYLFKLVRESNSLEVVYRTLGVKLVRTYRSVIMDLWKDKIRIYERTR